MPGIFSNEGAGHFCFWGEAVGAVVESGRAAKKSHISDVRWERARMVGNCEARERPGVVRGQGLGARG